MGFHMLVNSVTRSLIKINGIFLQTIFAILVKPFTISDTICATRGYNPIRFLSALDTPVRLIPSLTHGRTTTHNARQI